MIVLVDDRNIVRDGYESGFQREGVTVTAFKTDEFKDWIDTSSKEDLSAIEAFLLGECPDRESFTKNIRSRTRFPVIAMNDNNSLEQTLKLFSAGVDDVVKKPIHVREILARVAAIVSRKNFEEDHNSWAQVGDMKVYFDGRDPELAGRTLPLPRREQRILQRLARDLGKRVTKTQLYNHVYGIFNEDVAECVIESHVSKLRKKLRAQLGYDPIDSKRYLGYCLEAR